MNKTIDLSRFAEAHRRSYQTALEEIRNGRKRTHWMWYIFPQIHGLGCSQTSVFYAIRSKEEAIAFLNDDYLGKNLIEICSALLELKTNCPSDVFDWPDDKKLQSCMTLFSSISGNNNVFQKALDKYFGGIQDDRTLDILKRP